MSYVHINWTRYSDTRCVVINCPTCERQRRALYQFQDWYGGDVTCCGCGERWSDGEMNERPFCPGWRKENREHAIKTLATIGALA